MSSNWEVNVDEDDSVVCDRSCKDCSLWETNGREAFIPELSSGCLL